MAYIRSISNPEHLYVYDDGSIIHFYMGSVADRFMPSDVFCGLLRKYKECDSDKNNDELFKHMGATLEFKKVNNRDFKQVLNYTNWKTPLEMWDVTWNHIAK